MSRETWALIKLGKNFNVYIFRGGLIFIIISLILSCLMSSGIFYIYLNQPDRDFYATSGITPPIKLNPMDSRNDSSKVLLDPDPPVENIEKIIPQ